MNDPRYLIIHCSVSDFGDVPTIRKWHTDPPPAGRGWNDIGYHKILLNGHLKSKDTYNPALDGKIQQGRADDVAGAHCPGYNSRSLGICLIGMLDDHAPTDKQWAVLVDACVRLCQRYDIHHSDILGHRETPSGKKQGKSCPGRKVDMNHLRKLVAEKLFE